MPSEEYGEGVQEQLDAVEFDDSRKQLWNLICQKINVIFDNSQSAEARQHGIYAADGEQFWRIELRNRQEQDDWSVLWTETETGPMIAYVGPWPPLK